MGFELTTERLRVRHFTDCDIPPWVVNETIEQSLAIRTQYQVNVILQLQLKGLPPRCPNR